jgi:putative transposase
MLIDALRIHYPLKVLMDKVEISSSSITISAARIDFHVNTISSKNTFGRFLNLNSCYGYRPIHTALRSEGIRISETVVRKIMTERGLKAYSHQRRKYRSYAGEITPAVENIIARDFHAERPNVKWLTDITEFRIPAGKVYLSPVLDCYDGYLVNWTISTHPTADMVNAMLQTIDPNKS